MLLVLLLLVALKIRRWLFILSRSHTGISEMLMIVVEEYMFGLLT